MAPVDSATKAVMRGVERYTIKVWWSPSTDCFAGVVLELPGVSAVGSTRLECIRALDKNALSWIELREKMGQPVPTPGSGG